MTDRSSYQRLFSAAAVLLLTGSLAAFAAINPSQITLLSRPSGTTPGVQSNGRSFGPTSLTANGRLVAFSSFARNFFAPDSNSFSDIYIRDQANNFTSIVSLGNPTGGSGSTFNNRVVSNGDSSNPAISPNDGRFVAFQSNATNLDVGDSNTATDVYVRDRFGDAIRASVSSFGAQGPANQGSFAPSISDPQFDPVTLESRVFVAYHSDANNLDGLENPDNGSSDVFVTEIGPNTFFGSLQVNETRRISVATDGSPAGGTSRNASLSADGRYVVFESDAEDLVEDDTNGFSDIFVADLVTDTIEIISAERDEQGNVVTPTDGDSHLPSISADGRYVVYVSDTDDVLDPTDFNGLTDVFLYDRTLNLTTRVSVDSNGDDADGESILLDQSGDPDLASRPTVSADGQLVVFYSEAENLDVNDGNGFGDVFIHDLSDGETARLSVAGSELGDDASFGAALSANGNMVAFESAASTMVFDDNNFVSDIFAVGTGTGGGGSGNEPFADAGTDLLAFEQDIVFLDGTLSEDSQGGTNLTYLWTQVDNGAPAVELDDPTSPTPSFEAPLISEPTEFLFELVVSENGTASEPDDVAVFVDIAPPATLFGTVVDADFNPVVGATVSVIREDGEEADSVETDGAGNYEVQGVRVGNNIITVSAPDFEPEQREIEVFAGDFLNEDFQLLITSGAILGDVRRFDGSPVVDALVTLYDSEGEIIAEDLTDDAGEYFLEDLDRFDLAAGATLVVESDDLPTWTTSSFPRDESQLNVRNFQFGRLQVTVGASGKATKKLKNTAVTVKQGTEVLAEGFIKNAGKRKLTFTDVPGGVVKVQATNAALGSISANANIIEGGTTKVSLKFGVSNPF